MAGLAGTGWNLRSDGEDEKRERKKPKLISKIKALKINKILKTHTHADKIRKHKEIFSQKTKKKTKARQRE